ncbi:hypothetical protein EYF80_053635 [Liparis tanakae]|uniref:Uncharacterized protein n=1 Tax=Liparis tanakae TaxID=230148 RepID=A0A4Z2F5L0_9TELE|nr:hypothetical protein EYF80_053635 [Liparis tanakae]
MESGRRPDDARAEDPQPESESLVSEEEEEDEEEEELELLPLRRAGTVATSSLDLPTPPFPPAAPEKDDTSSRLHLRIHHHVDGFSVSKSISISSGLVSRSDGSRDWMMCTTRPSFSPGSLLMSRLSWRFSS